MSDISDQRRYYERMMDEIATEHQKQLDQLRTENAELRDQIRELWYLVNHRSGYGYAAALEHIEELGIEVDS